MENLRSVPVVPAEIIPRAAAQGVPAQEKNALNPLGHNL